MTLARRFLAVILGVVFVALAVPAFLIYHANATVLEPDFYVEQLDHSDVYEFAYDEAAPLAIREVNDRNPDWEVDVTPVGDRIVSSVREVFPPRWLHRESAEAISEVLPWMTGDRDTFLVSIDPNERLREAGPVLKEAVRDQEVIGLLYGDVLDRGLDEILQRQDDVPFDLAFTTEELQATITRLAPPAWLTAQFDASVDALVPYLIGEADGFSITIPLQDRAGVAAEEVKALLARKDLSAYVVEQSAIPQVLEAFGGQLVVPFNLTVTEAHVETVLRETLTEAWVQERAAGLVDSMAAYMTGAADSFELHVPLADRKAATTASVGRIMEEELRAAYTAAPMCSADQLAGLNYGALLRDGITCQVPGLAVEDLELLAGVGDYQGEVARLMGQVVPDSWTLSQADLERTLGVDQFQVIQDLRSWVIDGVTVTETDLVELIARMEYPEDAPAWSRLTPDQQRQVIAESDAVRRFDDFRADLRDGLTFSDYDLVEWLEEGGQDRASLSDAIGFSRGTLHDLRQWRILGVLALGLLLGAVGVLGGRRLATKVAWAAAFLIIASLVTYVAAGPVWEAYAGDAIAEAIEGIDIAGLDEGSELETLAVEKAQSVARNASDDFAAGLASRALPFLLLGLAGLAGSAGWLLARRRLSRGGADRYEVPGRIGG